MLCHVLLLLHTYRKTFSKKKTKKKNCHCNNYNIKQRKVITICNILLRSTNHVLLISNATQTQVLRPIIRIIIIIALYVSLAVSNSSTSVSSENTESYLKRLSSSSSLLSHAVIIFFCSHVWEDESLLNAPNNKMKSFISLSFNVITCVSFCTEVFTYKLLNKIFNTVFKSLFSYYYHFHVSLTLCCMQCVLR